MTDVRITLPALLEGHDLLDDADLDPILDAIGDARYVLIGEASHGTSEFYSWRARLSRRLIEERGFSFIGVEGDWPDLYDLNRYVKGYAGESALHVVDRFDRWPTWMWANWEVVAFAEWLRGHNAARPVHSRVGIYGLDVYSLWESMEQIIAFLRERDPDAVDTALEAWRCFEPYAQEGQAYGWSTLSLVPEGCVAEAVELLGQVVSRLPHYSDEWEAKLNLEQNAWVVVNAERYYRTMVRGGPSSWNLRDLHMTDTLDRLMAYHEAEWRGNESGDAPPKAIVWAHNTHVGDARATDMASAGMFNIGQLVRDRHGDNGVHLVGFGSHRGTVIAARAWGEDHEAMLVPTARHDSWEHQIHTVSDADRILLPGSWPRDPQAWMPRGHRAIGVVYHPEREHLGNFVPTVLPRRYDSFIYLDVTIALHPVRPEPHLDREPPETYPFGF